MLYDIFVVVSLTILYEYKGKRNNTSDYKWELVQQRYTEQRNLVKILLWLKFKTLSIPQNR